MAGRTANREVSELWKRLLAVRRRLDEQILSRGDESAFASTLAMHAEIVLRLRSSLERRSRSGEKLLNELRQRTEMEDGT